MKVVQIFYFLVVTCVISVLPYHNMMVLVWRLFSFQHFSAASSDILHVIEAGLEDWFM